MSEKVQSIQKKKISKIVRSYEKGIPLNEIAERAGVSAPTIVKWLTQEGYKHKKKGRIPLAMKARVRELHLRGWDPRSISDLLCLSIKKVEELSKPQENPILGGEKDPLKVKGQKAKKRKKKKKKKEEIQWPPPRHKCRKHWNADEKAYVIQLMQNNVSPGDIYKRMRASRSRQIKIWREAGGEDLPPNFPPPKDPFVPRGPAPAPEPTQAAAARSAEEDKIAELEKAAEDRRKKIRKLEAEKKKDEEKLKALAIQVRGQKEKIESVKAIAESRTKPIEKRKRVLAGSYEDEVLGLPVGSLVDPKKRKKKEIVDYADNGRYFVVSRDWADLADAKPDELAIFAGYLTSRRFPARVERSGDQPMAYFEGSWPKKVEARWVNAVDKGIELIDKYREKKIRLKNSKTFSKKIVKYLTLVYDGYRNQNLNSAQKAESRSMIPVQWDSMSKIDKLVMIYELGFANKDGEPTEKGIQRSQAAKMITQKAKAKKLKKIEKKKPEEDDISALLAAAQNRLALPDGEEDD